MLFKGVQFKWVLLPGHEDNMRHKPTHPEARHSLTCTRARFFENPGCNADRPRIAHTMVASAQLTGAATQSGMASTDGTREGWWAINK